MTVYSCHTCWTRHKQITTLSSVAEIHHGRDAGPEITKRGFFGCPQCASCCCVPCVEATSGICDCGGEFVFGVRYRFSGDGRLPPEIAVLRTTPERFQELDRLRQTKPMIAAEYNHLKMLIEQCQKIADSGVGLPENPGLSKMTKLVDLQALSNSDAWGILQDHAVASNVSQMVRLLDDRAIAYVEKLLLRYPATEAAWTSLLKEYDDPKYHPSDEVPYVSAPELHRRTKELVTILRTAISQRAD